MNLALGVVFLSAHLFKVYGAGVCDATVCYIGGRVNDINECDRTSESCPVCLVGTSDQAGCFYPSGGWCNQGTDCTGKEPSVAAAADEDSEPGVSTGAIAGIVVALIAVIAVVVFAINRKRKRRGNAETSAPVPSQPPAANQYQPPPVQQYQASAVPSAPIAEAYPVPTAQPVWQSQV